LGGLEAGCSAPVGALVTYDAGDLVLDAVAGAAFDRPELAMAGANAAGGILRHQLRGSSAIELGHEMAHYFLSRLVAGDVIVPDSPRSTTPGA
ncbi:MAG TPA: hypothetical protein VK045_03480, partial [Ornithinicoccus sp.]|nr:hypothetical protein [Ornithinicoccus sp.]